MADFVKNLFGGQKSVAPPSEDSDFADFAGAPAPASPAAPSIPQPLGSAATTLPTYTKWYRVWERTKPGDFVQEAIVLPIILLVILFHLWGRRTNRARARGWAAAHVPLLEKEFSVVGLSPEAAAKGVDAALADVEGEGLAKTLAAESAQAVGGGAPAPDVLRERAADDFECYATGRQHVACVDVRVQLVKRYNPLQLAAEAAMAFLFESFRAPAERAAATAYAFDGREKEMVPGGADGGARVKAGGSSGYDGFVWAVVHKDQMKTLRDDRYDVSLTATKDHARLPAWASVMSESAEITELLLTKDLVAAVEAAGPDVFEHLIITDQPVDRPRTVDEAKPRKRVTLSTRLPSGNTTAAYEPSLALFAYFLRLPDQLVSAAHFRAEVTKRLRAKREDEVQKLRKAEEESQAEDRKLDADKRRKAERDAKLKGLSAEEQRKFLDREREKDNRKQTKRVKG